MLANGYIWKNVMDQWAEQAQKEHQKETEGSFQGL